MGSQTYKQIRKSEPTKSDQPKVKEHISVEDIDAMLDEIDTVLEEDAEAFVKNYVQKPGQ